jgi:hypothetical protein
MPDSQPTRAAVSDALDAAILTVLLNEDANGPWSVDELTREFGHPILCWAATSTRCSPMT